MISGGGLARAPSVVASCRPRRPCITSCKAVPRDVSANATAVSVETKTADGSSSTSTKIVPPSEEPSAPYRVTDMTIEDIKSFHQSQLNEYDYIVEDDMVRGGFGRVQPVCGCVLHP